MAGYTFFLLFLFCLPFLSGCADKPEKPAAAYGKIITGLPKIDEAEKPFDFPYSGTVDHSKCVFNDEEF